MVNFCMQILNSLGLVLGNRMSEVERLACGMESFFLSHKEFMQVFFSLAQSMGNNPI